MQKKSDDYIFFTLPNGIRVVHKQTQSKVAYSGFFINAGCRDEGLKQYGIAHFCEHMLFKGTEKRKSFHILNRMESVGGELNAYTNKEETVVYSVFLKEHSERAIELMSDLVFSSIYPQKELDKERDVIIDEIHSYQDSPSELIFDDFENLVFDGSQIGHHILGSPKSLKQMDSSDLQLFASRYYSTHEIVFFSVGNIDLKRFRKIVDKYISFIPERISGLQRLLPPANTALQKTVHKRTSQAHSVIGGRAYSFFDDRRIDFLLLNNIIGGPGMNSRLNILLREKHGFAYTVESTQTLYSDSGLFTIYFSCDKNNLGICSDLVRNELKRFCNTRISDYNLQAAKKQLVGQLAINDDNNEDAALGMAKSILHRNEYRSFDSLVEQIETITSSQLLEVANELYKPENLFELCYT